MLLAIHIGFAEIAAIIGTIVVIRSLSDTGLLRWLLYGIVVSIILLTVELIDPYALVANIVLSNASPLYNLLTSLESIVVSSTIVFVTATIMLPSNRGNMAVVAILTASICLYNLWKYSSFTILPFGLDGETPQPIDWKCAASCIIAFCIFSWLFIGGSKKETHQT